MHKKTDVKHAEFNTVAVTTLKPYVAPKVMLLLHQEKYIAGSNQTNVAEVSGGFLAVS